MDLIVEIVYMHPLSWPIPIYNHEVHMVYYVELISHLVWMGLALPM
jgi:hypothetical protein